MANKFMNVTAIEARTEQCVSVVSVSDQCNYCMYS